MPHPWHGISKARRAQLVAPPPARVVVDLPLGGRFRTFKHALPQAHTRTNGAGPSGSAAAPVIITSTAAKQSLASTSVFHMDFCACCVVLPRQCAARGPRVGGAARKRLAALKEGKCDSDAAVCATSNSSNGHIGTQPQTPPVHAPTPQQRSIQIPAAGWAARAMRTRLHVGDNSRLRVATTGGVQPLPGHRRSRRCCHLRQARRRC